MAGTAELEALYSDIEKAAGLLDEPCSRDAVWPILTAYADALPPHAQMAYRVATNSAGLDFRIASLAPDLHPYALALANGLTEKTDHPVGDLLSDIQDRFPLDYHGVDFGVVDGFKKTWTFFPLNNLQKVTELADLPSMPRSLSENLEFFTRNGLDGKTSLIGIDYPSRTLNIYFLGSPPEMREPDAVRSMMREHGLAEPSEQMLTLAQQATGYYTTLSWDSSKIERITFAVVVRDLDAFPAGVEVDPKIEKFAKDVPYTYGPATRKGIYGVTAAPRGEYYKLQSWYQMPPQMVQMLAPDAG
ncbi:aromatic prenyltransferase [Actinomadura sp. 7K534]|uniref:aromatic prenyltransferase n=1 Tax=Actinomadura sp. 7K534 TaxID=2530366 RepID=UPI001046A97D|nr:aromatic prenyltransferase [Actinomadura sp. 7K534]TDB97301.1 prenyltransferase [Actinomadura sp. 7K534]